MGKFITDCILQLDDVVLEQRGQLIQFAISGQGKLIESRSIWLVTSDWLPLAEVSISAQSQRQGQLQGTLRVDYIYPSDEQAGLRAMLVRMFAGIYDPYIYFLIGLSEYQQAIEAGQLQRSSLVDEGFLHACPSAQLERLANKYYSQVDNLKVMVVDKDKIGPELKWEPASGGLYPHVYGPLNMDSVVELVAYELGEKKGVK